MAFQYTCKDFCSSLCYLMYEYSLAHCNLPINIILLITSFFPLYLYPTTYALQSTLLVKTLALPPPLPSLPLLGQGPNPDEDTHHLLTKIYHSENQKIIFFCFHHHHTDVLLICGSAFSDSILF